MSMKIERGPSYAEYEDQASHHGTRSGTPTKRVNIPTTTTSRIMDRKDKMFKRSKGQWNIRRQKVPHYWKLYMQDPFHTVVNMRLSKVLASLMFAYIVVITLFGALYMTPREECRLAISTFFDGFSFSVSVLFTIGFGTNGGDVFFGRCVWVQTIITLESFMGILLDALAIGIIFQRFSRAQARANTIVMSTHACVRRIRGKLYFMFQVCEMRKHQLVEAHVRLYAIRHDIEFGEHYYFQSYPMRIQHPDDDLGGMMLLALPSVVVHGMDAWSPLLRPKSINTCGMHHNPARKYLFPEPLCREADAQSGDRDASVQNNLYSHLAHNTCRCGGENIATGDVHAATQPPSIEEIQQYWAESQLEVVVLVEGIDAVTSTTIQVRHSYKAEDILFNHRHVNCVDIDPETGGALVDFRRFHETVPVDIDCSHVSGSFY
ncbi:animal inward rectifier k channel (irk-c) family protein [Plasmopara halstedii]|uniref:Animal inward rectifier k channel (Irk-c) family protein n=1 Tax=Plasmopara halstedii TaxID=4781 RepID=A0A0P1B2K8_PLAHL|nr:animal inward rectifier k channel (irk-c) family protein [Plasmopara halstedii]CEG48949.1 animal inward rectifier k channel (irk-c) family protein [Plasmopara halstedii]|eukprot:XP_024585318.1 animal inward rectifier k channel (irk-c) family protein [Plasmopara halstedii]